MSYFNKQFKDNERLGQNPLLPDCTVRSTFDRSHTNKTTFTSGQLIPIYFDEVLPGDTHIIDFKYLIRMSTPKVPTLDNSVIDFHFFYVPTRIIWNDWKRFMGENTSQWAQTLDISCPRIWRSGNIVQDAYWYKNQDLPNMDYRNNGYKDGDLASYLGVPTYVDFINTHSASNTLNVLPFFAYAQIWNDWYRDQNLQDEILIPKDGIKDNPAWNYVLNINSIVVEDPYNPKQGILAGFGTLPVSKLPDYFTTCLPSPQKGAPVGIKFNSMIAELPDLEVVNRNAYATQTNIGDLNLVSNWGGTGTNDEKYNKHRYQFLQKSSFDMGQQPNNENVLVGGIKGRDYLLSSGNGYWTSGFLARNMYTSNTTWAAQNTVDSRTLYHDLIVPNQNLIFNNITTGLTINDLRLAFATQQFLEKDSRGGTRYIEILRNHFGIISPDARLQRSEYIGGRRDYTNINQVINQTSTGVEQTPLGQTGAISLTAGSSNDTIVYSATEHGYIMGFVIVRPLHTYSQGIPKAFSRFHKFDYYWPEFANIGEQPVYNREIFVEPSSSIGTDPNLVADTTTFNTVFGYNEAWADYRYKLNKSSGWFSPNSPNYLSMWTYTDNYNNAPVLSEEWMKENRGNIAQTLALIEYDQFLIDCYFDVKSTRPLPVFSIPGLNRM